MKGKYESILLQSVRKFERSLPLKKRKEHVISKAEVMIEDGNNMIRVGKRLIEKVNRIS